MPQQDTDTAMRMRNILPGKLAHVAAALFALLSVNACSKPEPADVVEIIGGAQPCVGCRVELGPPMELRNEGSGAFVVSPSTVSMDAQGRFWVAELNHVARVFDASGKFLRTVGTTGAPATELGIPIAFLPLPGDSMLVFDFEKNTQAFVLDSLFHSVRAVHLPDTLLPASAVGWPARVLMSGRVSTATAAGWTLHLASAEEAELNITKSFGNDKISRAQAATMARFQRVTAANDGGYWSADIQRYRVSHFAKDGTLLGTIERHPDWFPSPSAGNIGTPNTPPPPTLFGLWQAPDGLLWVFGRVAGKNWKEAWPAVKPGMNEVNLASMPFEKLFGTVIEVIDPVTRAVMTTAKLDDYITDVLPNGNVAVYSADSSRVGRVGIVRLSLAR